MKSPDRPLQFGPYTLDARNRVLLREGEPVELGSRYFDALKLLADHPGELITKQRLHDEVWRGVPVTDEALTQCIRSLRRILADDAGNPSFIETVPRHGYRFVAPVESVGAAPAAPATLSPAASPEAKQPGIARWLMLTGSGGLGGAAAGAAIGLLYGLILVQEEQASGAGLSLVAVILCSAVLAALFSGLAIAGGVAAGDRLSGMGRARWILGGAAGGLVAGSLLNMLGRDAVNLLFGRRMADLAGGLEGLVLGAVIGGGIWWLRRVGGAGLRDIGPIALLGAVSGFALPLAGGTLFAGSLAALAATVPDSPFALPAPFAALGPLGGALEGALFTAGVTLGIARASGGAGST